MSAVTRGIGSIGMSEPRPPIHIALRQIRPLDEALFILMNQEAAKPRL